MKKTFKLIAISSLVAIALQASTSPNRVEVDITAGVNKFDSESRLSKNNATFYGIRGTIFDSVVDKYGFQLAYEGAYGVDYKRLSSVEQNKHKESDVHRLFANMIVDGNKEWGIVPYILLGAGYEYLSDEIKGEVSQGIADAGLGFRYYTDYGFHIGLEGKAIGKYDSHDIDYMANFILGYAFNGPSKQIEAPKQKLYDVPKVETSSDPRTIINEVNVAPNQEVQQYPNYELTEKEAATTYNDSYSQEISSTPVASPSNSYYIQLAAYRSTNPANMLNRARSRGFTNADVIEDSDERGLLTRVVVGPYEDRYAAKRDLSRVKRTLERKAFIIRH